MKLNTLTAKIILASCAAGAALSTNAEIEEVIVTATKRAESIQDVPISISAFSSDFIANSGIGDLQELGSYAPNLYLSKSSQVANQRILIRGLGSAGNNAIDPSVAVFIDGVHYPRPSSVVGKLQDIEVVEVLRGPQGTLFGRNASAGTLNIRTKKPARETTADITLSAGNFDQYAAGINLNGGLTENVAGRLSIQYSDRGGFGDSDFDNSEIGEWEDTGIRGALLFDINENLTATLRADWKEIENNGTLIDILPDSVLPRYASIIAGALDPDGPLGPLAGPAPDLSDAFDYDVNQQHLDRAEDEQWGISLDIEWELAGHTLRSITAYRDWENEGFESAIRLPADLFPRVTEYNAETFSQEFQLTSTGDGPLQYVAGLYYYQEDYEVNQSFNLGSDFCPTAVSNLTFARAFDGTNPAVARATANTVSAFCSAGPQIATVASPFEQEVDSFAVYAQGTYEFNEHWSATLGVRWTDDEKDGNFDTVINNPIAGPPPAPGAPGLSLRAAESQELSFSDSEVTWLANLQYRPIEDILLFLSASTGYKSGGFNSESTAEVLGDQRIFASETVDNYEFGVKSTLFDSVLLNATYFVTEIDGYQDRLFDGLSFFVVNAGELRQQGLEVDLNARVTDNLSATLGYSYLDSKFLQYDDGTNLPAFDQAVPQDLSGARANFSPNHQLSTSLEWRDALTGSLEWFIRGEYQYTGEQNVNAQTDNNPAQVQDDYGLVNARLGIGDASGKWSITLYGRNLDDKGYCQTTFYQPLADTLRLQDPATGNALTRCVAGEPRTYGVEFKYNLL